MNWVVRFAPLVFVLLWSTGYIGAKYGLPHAEPFTFLAIRMALALGLLVLLAWMSKAPWPNRTQAFHAAIAGLLLHGGYLGGLFFGIRHGVPAGLSAIIVNLQPVLVSSLAAWALGEPVLASQWLGLGLGFAGVMLAVFEKLGAVGAPSAPGLIACVVALCSSTLGTVYQKRFGAKVLLTSTAVQYLACVLVFGLLALTSETRSVEWTPAFVLTLAWFVGPISLGAILLLLWMISQGSAASVSSLFYLVPPLTALQAHFLFGERLGWPALLGFVLTMIGVALVLNPQTKTAIHLPRRQA